MSDVDVVIVGAGAAGLAAAKSLHAQGLTTSVLEAMDRIGGRAWTRSTDFGVPFDIGCAWLHAADRNPFLPEAQSAGWTLHHHDMSLDHLYYGSRRADAAEMAAIVAAEDELGRLMEGDGPDDDRLSSLLNQSRASRATATFCGPMDFAKDADEISVADFRNAADLDPNYFTLEGFGTLIHRFGADVPVALSTPVQRIDWSGPGVSVEGRVSEVVEIRRRCNLLMI